MASTLNPENTPRPDRELNRSHDTAALGPSDTSDTGSDAAGTGERATAGRDISFSPGRDIDTDHVERLAPEDFEHDESDRNAEPDRNQNEHPHSRRH